MMERDVFRDQFFAAFDAFIPGVEGVKSAGRFVNFADARRRRRGRRGARGALALIAAFALARLAFAAALGLGDDEVLHDRRRAAARALLFRSSAAASMDRPFRRAGARRRRGDAAAVRRAVRRDRLADVRADAAPVRRARRPDRARRAQPDAVLFRFGRRTWVVPDGPLLFALAGAARALARLLFDRAARRAPRSGPLARCRPLRSGSPACRNTAPCCRRSGSSPFVALSPRQRPLARASRALSWRRCSRWRSSRRSLVWNAEHGWVSFAFQGARAEAAGRWRPAQVGAHGARRDRVSGALDLRAAASPRSSTARGARRSATRSVCSSLCLALPPIVVFTLTPLWGARGLPHWPMPGWFFVYPLLGRLARRACARRRRASGAGDRRGGGCSPRSRSSSLGQAATGWATRLVPLGSPARSTRRSKRWTGAACATAPAIRSAAFVVATKWMDGGKIGLALGPANAGLRLFRRSARHRASSTTARDFVGRDAAIVVAWDTARGGRGAACSPISPSFDAPQSVIAAARRARRNRAGGHPGARLDARLSSAVSALRRLARIARALERARDDFRSGGG